jgi:hypothetical protein
MAKWVETKSIKYGLNPPNYAKQHKLQTEKEEAMKNLKKKFRIIGGIIVALGMLGIGLTIFTSFNCLFIAIMVLAIGLAMLWSTENIY